jgi:hypothetical protein
MNRTALKIVLALGILSAILLMILWRPLLYGVFLLGGLAVLFFLSAVLPRIVIEAFFPEITKEELEKILSGNFHLPAEDYYFSPMPNSRFSITSQVRFEGVEKNNKGEAR